MCVACCVVGGLALSGLLGVCVGVFVLEFEFLCHLDLSQQAFGITVVLWIPIRGIGLLIVLWTTVWCYTKQPTF